MYCIYHKNCPDGFAAATVVYKKYGHKYNFLPLNYGDEIPFTLTSKDKLIICDFSFPRVKLEEMHDQVKSLVVLDHHKTAQKELEGLDYCVFDMNKSGAVLTWEYLFPDSPVPLFLQYIQDRDLWTWKLPYSKEISAGLGVYTQDFDIWNSLIDYFDYGSETQKTLYNQGDAILTYQNRWIDSFLTNDRLQIKKFEGYAVPFINTPYLISEIGNRLSDEFPFVVLYFDVIGKRIYSLRSKKVDVSEIAKKYGGGGHKFAAGFTMARIV